MNSRIAQLRADLHRWNREYYVDARPSVSDADYDRAMAELRQLERDHPEDADPTSPTQRVGSDLTSSFAKVPHEVPMLSLDNVFTASELSAFFRQHATVGEWKIDGLSCSLIYKGGKLVRAVTRGDGSVGDDVTLNVKTIRTVPLQLYHTVDIEVRGEVCMTNEVFNALNAQREADGDELFANPRNAAAGSLKQKDPKVTASRRLSFIAYQAFVGGDFSYNTQVDMLNDLHRLGFVTTLDLPSPSVVVSDFQAEIDRRAGVRESLPFEVDGIVFKVNDVPTQRELGTGTKSPKWAVAFKFPPQRKVTRLMSITVQVGRTGVLTPAAELQPISLSGSVVKRASLCNQDEVERLGINVGSNVFVEKAAEIIPKVVGVESRAVPWKMPSTCPCCHTPVVRESGKVAFKCPNFDCHDQALQRLLHAVGKSALDWDGFGEAQAEAFIVAGLTRLSQIFNASDEEIKVAIGTGSAFSKFKSERERVKTQPLWRKLHALGIEMVGATLCKELAARWPSLAEIADSSEVRDVLGPVKSASFSRGLSAMADEIGALDDAGLKFEEKRVTGALSGKVFCITGTLMSGTRPAVSKRIEDVGGIVKGSVGKATHYLVVGEAPGGNKTAAAKKYGTKVLTEEQLYDLIGIPMPVVDSTAEDHDY